MGQEAPSPASDIGEAQGESAEGKFKVVAACQERKEGRGGQLLAKTFQTGAFQAIPRKMRLKYCEQRFPGAKKY